MAVCRSFAVRREPVGKPITAALILADGPGGGASGPQMMWSSSRIQRSTEARGGRAPRGSGSMYGAVSPKAAAREAVGGLAEFECYPSPDGG